MNWRKSRYGRVRNFERTVVAGFNGVADLKLVISGLPGRWHWRVIAILETEHLGEAARLRDAVRQAEEAAASVDLDALWLAGPRCAIIWTP